MFQPPPQPPSPNDHSHSCCPLSLLWDRVIIQLSHHYVHEWRKRCAVDWASHCTAFFTLCHCPPSVPPGSSLSTLCEGLSSWWRNTLISTMISCSVSPATWRKAGRSCSCAGSWSALTQICFHLFLVPATYNGLIQTCPAPPWAKRAYMVHTVRRGFWKREGSVISGCVWCVTQGEDCPELWGIKDQQENFKLMFGVKELTLNPLTGRTLFMSTLFCCGLMFHWAAWMFVLKVRAQNFKWGVWEINVTMTVLHSVTLSSLMLNMLAYWYCASFTSNVGKPVKKPDWLFSYF